jgi:hypothetical protein
MVQISNDDPKIAIAVNAEPRDTWLISTPQT